MFIGKFLAMDDVVPYHQENVISDVYFPDIQTGFFLRPLLVILLSTIWVNLSP